MTNADKIRSMTEDELAQFLYGLTGQDACPPWGELRCFPDRRSCEDCWWEWLDSEVGS